jgi:hypothetical protein
VSSLKDVWELKTSQNTISLQNFSHLPRAQWERVLTFVKKTETLLTKLFYVTALNSQLYQKDQKHIQMYVGTYVCTVTIFAVRCSSKECISQPPPTIGRNYS